MNSSLLALRAAGAAMIIAAVSVPSTNAQIPITANLALNTRHLGTLLDPATSPDSPNTWAFFTFTAGSGRTRVEVDRITSQLDPASGAWVGSPAGLNYSAFTSIFSSGALPLAGAGDDDVPPATGVGSFGDPFYSFSTPNGGVHTTAVSGFANGPMPVGGYKFSITVSEVEYLVVESAPGGANHASYSETGEFANTSGKSLVAEATPGIGARFGSTFTSVVGPKHALFAPELPTAGLYNVFTTWGNVGNRRDGVLHRVTHLDGATDVLVDQTIGSSRWHSLGTFRFGAGLGGSVDISNTGLNLSGNFVADAVMWELVAAVPEPRSAALAILALSGVITRAATRIGR